MNIKCFVCNMLQENCYVVSDDTGQAVVIDCGAYYEEERRAVVGYIRDNRLSVAHLLCTHGHFDHCFGNDTIWQEFGVCPEVSSKDEWLMDMDKQMRTMIGIPYEGKPVPLGPFLRSGEEIVFGNHTLSVLSTPGHTPGGLSFYCQEEQVVFTGDTLFRMSVGRTDFDRGSWEQLYRSLSDVIGRLPEETVVYPGHGPKTSIREELQMNPYMR